MYSVLRVISLQQKHTREVIVGNAPTGNPCDKMPHDAEMCLDCMRRMRDAWRLEAGVEYVEQLRILSDRVARHRKELARLNRGVMSAYHRGAAVAFGIVGMADAIGRPK